MSERKGALDLLEDAIVKTRTGIDLSRPGDPNWATYLRNHTTMLVTRFAFKGSVADLREAIRLGKEAKEFIPPGSPNYAEVLTLLCGLHADMFSFSRDMNDIERGNPGRKRVAKIAAQEQTPKGEMSVQPWWCIFRQV